MSDKKFKDAKRTNFVVGDRVKIINCSSIEPYELNEIGVVVNVEKWDVRNTYIVDMGRPRRPESSGDNETCWWLQESMIELADQPNTQLLFSFMY